jgi:acylphosphatase
MSLSGTGSDNGASSATGQHWLINGRVQGVGYRMWLEAEARALGIAGWVRNLADGRVEAVLHGSTDALTQLAAAARQGPRSARVDRVEVMSWPKPVPEGVFTQVATAALPEGD